MHVTYIERSPGIWRLRIERGKDGAGKRLFSYETVRGTEDDAARRRFEIIKGAEEGSWAKPDKLTLGAYLKRWLEQRQAIGIVNRGSAEYYGHLFGKHVIPRLGGLRLQAMPGHEIQALYTRLLTQPEPLAAVSVVLLHRVLKVAFTDARKARLIVVNPMDEVTAPRSKRKGAPRALDAAGLERLLREIEGHQYEDAIKVALGTGMRRGEICGLRWCDVDFNRGRLTVAGQVVMYLDGTMERKETKTEAGERKVSLPGPVVDLLRGRRARAAAESMAAGKGSIEEHYVFAPREGETPLRPHTLTDAFTRVCVKLGLHGITFHGTRHTHITELLKHVGETGAKAVSERVGHADVKFTLSTYQSVFEDDDKALGDIAAGMFRNRGIK